ncbi:MAG: beta-galactosidase trimerization domain-containing protein [Verrucomicrobiota bacterium]|nr:beta-galactosidase trimerization domain-containing protein [Verrucomicrobiota bacterium]
MWTLGGNLAAGFDRMHTWLALAHAQVPVDIISEGHAASGLLDEYQVCYLSGPNLTRAAAAKLGGWVRGGGTLWLTAGAATRDEYNRPLQVLDELLPATRGGASELQKYSASGKYLGTLSAKDEVRWDGGVAEVLAVKQTLAPHEGAVVLARFKDESPALVRAATGKGTVYCAGFLPALAYIKQALDARNAVQERVKQSASAGRPLSPQETRDAELLERSYNPWEYPADVRQFILLPVRSAGVARPIECSAPLVDAVYMPEATGVLIPFANYTLEPIDRLALTVQVSGPIARVESARHGPIAFK